MRSQTASPPTAERCVACGFWLDSADLRRGGDVARRARLTCRRCRHCVTPYCRICQRRLHDHAFASGRAVRLLGRDYCTECLSWTARRGGRLGDAGRTDGPALVGKVVWKGRKPRVTPVFRRIPPDDCRLSIREGPFGRNLVLFWADYTEEELGVTLTSPLKRGVIRDARIDCPVVGLEARLELRVLNSSDSRLCPEGAFVRFGIQRPGPPLRQFFREVLRRGANRRRTLLSETRAPSRV